MLNGVNLYMEREEMSLLDWELLLDAGWDRVGTYFFHRQFDLFQPSEDLFAIVQLMPLRYNLGEGFKWSKSQKQIFKRNSDLVYQYRPALIDAEKIALFDAWYAFRFGRKSSLATWVSSENRPFSSYEVSVYKDERLIAASFFDVSLTVQYSTIAFFDPAEAHRSLGTLTLMLEILHGIKQKKEFHYPGHAYYESSAYEYKKKFHNMEYFNWDTEGWHSLGRKV